MCQKKIIHYIEEQAVLHPNNMAVIDDSSQLTYQELSAKSNAFCDQLLKDYNIAQGDFVAVQFQKKTTDAITALLGIMKAEAVFLPINSDHPQPTVNAILESTKAKLLLTDSDNPNAASRFLGNIKVKKLQDKLETPVEYKDIVYAIYTSGTTGKPKGVCITNKSLIATYLSWQAIFKLTNNDNHLQMANMSFDLFIGDFVRSLCSGGTLVLCPKEILLRAERLLQKINDPNYPITVAEFVPATLNNLISYLEENNLNLSVLRLLLCGSDLWFVKDALRALQRLNENASMMNTYGSSETTIDSTFYKATRESLSKLAPDSIVPIGHPFPHVSFSVWDESCNDLPINTGGELIIKGVSVSPFGYIDEPKLTEERFVRDPKNPHILCYRTGDMVELLSNGCINFQGRNENHLNIDGKRIELPNIEHALNKHEKIEFAVVSPYKDDLGHLRLAAYVILKTDDISQPEIIHYLEQYLPAHAIPTRYYKIDQIPLTTNGKINRNVPPSCIKGEIVDKSMISDDPLISEIQLVWSEVIGVTSIPLSNSFDQLGGNSLLYLKMLDIVNERFNITLAPCEKLSTVTDIAAKIRSSRQHLETNLHESEISDDYPLGLIKSGLCPSSTRSNAPLKKSMSEFCSTLSRSNLVKGQPFDSYNK